MSAPARPDKAQAALMTDTAAESAARKEFDARVDHLLQTTCEVARALV